LKKQERFAYGGKPPSCFFKLLFLTISCGDGWGMKNFSQIICSHKTNDFLEKIITKLNRGQPRAPAARERAWMIIG
jgi:hypothetical protein